MLHIEKPKSMTHIVTGLIARQGLLAPIAESWLMSSPIGLVQGFELLPLQKNDIDRIFGSSTRSSIAADFERLSTELIEGLMNVSTNALILYFETEYFGGDGSQGAALFHEGRVVFIQTGSIGPINRGLALLGVRVATPAIDEFQSIGLDRHRATEDWLISP
jgi:hypothetical protein